MPMYGKCPECKQLVSRLDISTLTAHTGTKEFNAAMFLCPHCQTILGAGIDPAAVGMDLLDRVAQVVRENR